MKKYAERYFLPKQALPYILVVGGIIGFLASFILTVEKIELIKNPAYLPSCNLSPILSCGSVMNTPQAEVFGFPNSLIGVAGFAIIVTIGMALLAGAKFKRWFWLGLQAGVLFGIIFVTWLQFQSIYRINALCPYCMVVWAVMIPIFWYTTLHNLQQGYIKASSALVSFLTKNHFYVLTGWFLIIIGLILERFWDYWKTLI